MAGVIDEEYYELREGPGGRARLRVRHPDPAGPVMTRFQFGMELAEALGAQDLGVMPVVPGKTVPEAPAGDGEVEAELFRVSAHRPT
jgi:hypothetical protein